MGVVCLIDCNNFFVSCERLFRPDLRKKPVLVLSSNDGCVVARSEEVKNMGIPMGIPFFKIEKLCKEKEITIFSSNFTLYRDISSRVMETLAQYVDQVEVYSIDEAFFRCEVLPSVEEIERIRTEIMRSTGIPVSIGVSETMTLAKIANHDAKKGNGVSFLAAQELIERHGNDLVGSVWGIGRHVASRLREHGIIQIRDFIDTEDRILKRIVGVLGQRIKAELLGTPAVHALTREVPLSITSTRSFGEPQDTLDGVMSALAHHATVLGERLRSDALTTQQITIFAAPSRFGDFSHHYQTKTIAIEPTASTALLIREIRRLLTELFVPGIPYTRSGVILGKLAPKDVTTHTLFQTGMERVSSSDTIEQIIDTINTRFGNTTLHYGVTKMVSSWNAKRARGSQNYTTRWDEILKVQAK